MELRNRIGRIPKFWVWSLLILPLIFIVWSLSLIVTVNRRQEAVSMNVGLINKLNGLEESIRDFDRELTDTADKDLRSPWPQLQSNYRSQLERFGSKELARHDIQTLLTRIDSFVDVMNQIRSSESLKKAQIEREFHSHLNQAIDEVKSAKVAIRARLTDLSLELSNKWLQLNILVFISCGLALFVTVLLIASRRMIAKVQAAKTTLALSEERFRKIFEDGPLGMAISGLEKQFVKVNSIFCKILGYNEEELTSLKFPDITHEDNLERDLTNFQKLLKGEISCYKTEKRYRKKNGDILWGALTASVIKDQQGRPAYLLAMIEDITERKWSEEQLLKLSRAVEQSPASVVITDVEGNIEYVNPKFTRLTGYTFEEVVGKNPRILKSGKQSPRYYKGLWRTITSGKEWRGEFCNKKKNGELYWEMASVSPLRNNRGAITHFVGVKEDITERKQAAESLKKSEERYRTLFEDSKDAIFVCNRDGKLIDINPAGVELFGFSSKAEIMEIGSVRNLYADSSQRNLLMETLEKQGYVKDYELVLKDRDGNDIFVLLSATVVRDPDGQIVAHRGVLHDLTQRKKLEEQMRHVQKMETLGTLAGGIAHDFNNLLVVILGNLEFGLQDCQPDDKVYQHLLKIQNAAQEARDLVNRLLSFSRQQANTRKMTNLNQIIMGLKKVLNHVVGDNIELKIRIEPILSQVWADHVQMRQILLNLCMNARDAMPRGGRLVLKTANVAGDEIEDFEPEEDQSSNYVCLTITDTGTGMDKETQARIFEPFFTTKPHGRGTGLGLSVVYGIVKHHDGHIRVDSQKGKGTTFRIYFPTIPEIVRTEQDGTATASSDEFFANAEQNVLK